MNKQSKKNLPIMGMPGYVKDTSSGAILNNDNKALEAYKRQKKLLNDSRNNNKRLESLENEMSDIKKLLRGILEKL